MMFRPVLENVISLTIFFYSARRRRKIFQIVCEKINFGSKIRVPPPGKMKNFSFLPKTYFSPGIFKSEFPPGQTYSKILISLQNFGEKWHYVRIRLLLLSPVKLFVIKSWYAYLRAIFFVDKHSLHSYTITKGMLTQNLDWFSHLTKRSQKSSALFFSPWIVFSFTIDEFHIQLWLIKLHIWSRSWCQKFSHFS